MVFGLRENGGGGDEGDDDQDNNDRGRTEDARDGWMDSRMDELYVHVSVDRRIIVICTVYTRDIVCVWVQV